MRSVDKVRATRAETLVSQVQSSTPIPLVVGGMLNDLMVGQAIRAAYENQARALNALSEQLVNKNNEVGPKRGPGF